MNIKEAIPILEDLTTTLPQVSPELRRKAVALGIEAMKREEKRRRFAVPDKVDLLPGEEKE